jgi:hypothetical protein
MAVHNNQEVDTAVHECLKMEEPNFSHDRIFKLIPSWDTSIKVLAGYDEKL